MVRWVFITSLIMLAGCARPPKFESTYHAVLLDNGAVYFGRLEGFGTPYPILNEVYYVQNGVNPQTKEATNVLIRRGKEWHEPDRMALNASHILFVEPVGKDSRVAQLIRDLKSK